MTSTRENDGKHKGDDIIEKEILNLTQHLKANESTGEYKEISSVVENTTISISEIKLKNATFNKNVNIFCSVDVTRIATRALRKG
eukprot:CAMPEP_0197053304 /NCGR_PEP_ID=MMETSP1384-20130603/27620_1 /TAXON_ID=29189 /ORGANISM="Ammonia sp." /LENGTH=84 /DNA_ID=CAMNT_0042486185 /DNA_START=128 /DNA_END=378 /DNA_ORIENTATION=-